MQPSAFHQAPTSGHKWNSFYFLNLAYNPRDFYYRVYKILIILRNNNDNDKTYSVKQSQGPYHALALQELPTSKKECLKILSKNVKR